MRPTIDLEWTRDPEGYDLVKAEHEHDPEEDDEDLWKWRYTPLADAGGYFLPEYKRLVDEFISPPPKPKPKFGIFAFDDGIYWWLHIRGKSGKLESVRPFHGAPDLFKEFAAIQTPEQVLDFVNRNGLLEGEPSNEVRFILDRAQGAHGMLVRRSKRIGNSEPSVASASTLARLNMSVEVLVKQAGPSEAPTLTFRPKTLLDGLRLQMAYALADEHPPRACRQCGEAFEGRRPDAAFCSLKCRERWFSLERTRRKHRAQPGLPRRSPRSAKASRP